MASATVIGALRRFLPDFLREHPMQDRARRRAIWALTHCRTEAMGGHVHGCAQCGTRHFAYHSCNHRSCPQCGRSATQEWVERELGKRIAAPYFMVTFTLPQQLRQLFLAEGAKAAFDLFFAASSAALRQGLAARKGPGAAICGFTGVLHTWNQRLQPHIHIHYLVPGAGLDAAGRFVTVKNANFLVPLPVLQRAFQQHFKEALATLGVTVDPAVWTREWGVHIAPFGSGENAIKYLGSYISRTAIGNHRILSMTQEEVTFRWKDRTQGGRRRLETIPGKEFCLRFLRHVLPCGMRAVRYFGFCHPAAKATRERVAFLSGRTLVLDTAQPDLHSRTFALNAQPSTRAHSAPLCPCCHQPMPRLFCFHPSWSALRGPPLPA